MISIEQITLLHQHLYTLACHPGASRERIYILNTWASNQEQVSLNFRTYIALRDIPPTDPNFNAFCQGFFCVEIHLTARIGGCHHDGSRREITEINWHILDRLAGAMAENHWSGNGAVCSKIISFDEIIPLVKKLIGYQGPDITS